MRSQYRPGVWSQCPGSYGLMNSWSWMEPGATDLTTLGWQAGTRSLHHGTCQGMGQGNTSQLGALILLEQEDWETVSPLSLVGQ